MTPATVSRPPATSSAAAADQVRALLPQDPPITPERRRALEAERDRCRSTIHAVEMADAPMMAEIIARRNARTRIHEIDELIGVANGPSDRQQLIAIKGALESIVLHLTTRGERIQAAGRVERIAYDASFVEFSVAGLKKMIGRIES